MLNVTSLVFNPFELIDLDHASPLDEIKPDVNFYYDLKYQSQSISLWIIIWTASEGPQEVASRMIFSAHTS